MGAPHLHEDPRPGSPTDHQPTTWKEMAKKWPKQTFLIVGNELCERFSFYGMRAVLTLYLFNILGFNSSHSTVLFHAFTVICYTSPLLGSILADGFIGKFWTIFFVSIFYTCGQILLAFSSIAPSESAHHPFLDLLGLLIVGLGTGGIKPCVSAFGGDQFPAHYTRMISVFFSMFYFSINAGSVISMFLTPKMRSLSCFGNDSCYPLAFGIPAFLMIVATMIFMAGSFWYKKIPPKENVIFKVVRTVTRALRNKVSSSSVPRSHWLEYSLEGHDCALSSECKELHGNCARRKFIEDIKQLIKVIIMLTPMPMFWALYDQQGSTWVLQAVAMDTKFWGFELLPDQMGLLNAFLILLLIPLFQSFVYPFVEKCGFKLTMLRKMAAGGILTAISFFVCGVVQLFVNSSLPYIPMANEAHLTIINTLPTCDFRVKIDDRDPFDLMRGSGLNAGYELIKPYSFIDASQFTPTIIFNNESPICPKFTANLSLSGGLSYVLTLSPNGWSYNPIKMEKPSKGKGEFGMALNLMIPCESIPNNVTWKNCSGTEGYKGVIGLCRVDGDQEHPCDPKSSSYHQLTTPNSFVVRNYSINGGEAHYGSSYAPTDLMPGSYRLYYIKYLVDYSKSSPPNENQVKAVPFDLPALQQSRMGGVYLVTVSTKSRQDSALIATTETMVRHNDVSILWQFPQYFIITAGEVLFSVTGLEFAYSEASPQLKSVVQALYLFTTAIGDLIVVVIFTLNLFSDVAVQMFVFGTIMLLVIGVFILLAVFFYEYAEYANESETLNEKFIIDDERTRI